MAVVVMALMGEGGDCCAYGGDPVNLATGNFIYAYDYLAFDSRPRMSLRLFYNSHGRGTSPLGMGWTHPFAVSLAVEFNRAVVSMEDGHAEIFLGTPERGLPTCWAGLMRFRARTTGTSTCRQPASGRSPARQRRFRMTQTDTSLP